MNIAIVEDSEVERELLRNIVSQYFLTHQLDFQLDLYERAEDLLADFHPHRYGLIFLDIYMDGMSGVEAAEQIRRAGGEALLIFLTSSSAHMPEAFRVHAYDYILKPIDSRLVYRVLDDLMKHSTDEGACLRFTSDRKEYSLPYDNIASVRTEDHYLEISTADGASYRPRMTFAAASEALTADPRFLNILRGVLVNMDHIKGFEEGSCEMKDGLMLPVNLRKWKELEKTWQNYIFQKKNSSGAVLKQTP